MTNAHKHLSLALELAECARLMLTGKKASQVGYSVKQDNTPVTKLDLECEQALREIIARETPDFGVWGEEFGNVAASTCWVIDPIDGTTSFITDAPLYSTLIALVEDGRPSLGVIEMPALNRRLYAANGVGASVNGSTERPFPHKTQGPTELKHARAAMTLPPNASATAKIVENCACVRYGGDAFNFASVADGSLDIALDENLKPHDYAALLPVCEAAGCAWSDFNAKRPAFGENMDIIIAANQALLDEALATIAKERS